jgi:hypothetical protein
MPKCINIYRFIQAVQHIPRWCIKLRRESSIYFSIHYSLFVIPFDAKHLDVRKLRERAAVLRSMYIASLVIKPELRNNLETSA